MDIRKIKKLIELLEDSGLAEIEIRQGEESIRISRASSAAAALPAPAPVAAAPAAPPAAETPAAPASAEPALPPGHPVKSPMVGTFYSAATPEAKPFVDVGTVVSVGDTLCIIEAMKIFNEIEADRAGKVVAVLKTNGEAVEYGEPLFIIG